MASVSAFIQEINTISKRNLSLLHRKFLKAFIAAHKELFIRLSLDKIIVNHSPVTNMDLQTHFN